MIFFVAFFITICFKFTVYIASLLLEWYIQYGMGQQTNSKFCCKCFQG